jgi:hypothetical protein
MKKIIIVCCLVVVVTIPLIWAGTSSAQLSKEKQDILVGIQLLEDNPLRLDAKDLRSVITKFATDSPDVHVSLEHKYAKIASLDYKYAKELAFYYLAGCVKFDLQNPELASDATADIVSGVDSVITAYSNIIIANPKVTNSFLDDLLNLKFKGQLTLANIESKFKS